MEAYSVAAVSWMAREFTEDMGDLVPPLASLPRPPTGPLMVPFPLPFPRPPCGKEEDVERCEQAPAELQPKSPSAFTVLMFFFYHVLFLPPAAPWWRVSCLINVNHWVDEPAPGGALHVIHDKCFGCVVRTFPLRAPLA